MMRGMRELMQRQQQLLDRSFRAERQDETGSMGRTGRASRATSREANRPAMGDAAGQQDALRHSSAT